MDRPAIRNKSNKPKGYSAGKGQFNKKASYGSGILDESDGFVPVTRIGHVNYFAKLRGNRLTRVASVEGLQYCSKSGVTIICQIAGFEGVLFKVEHFDLWTFEMGPECLLKYIAAHSRERTVKNFMANGKCLEFKCALFSFARDRGAISELCEKRRKAIRDKVCREEFKKQQQSSRANQQVTELRLTFSIQSKATGPECPNGKTKIIVQNNDQVTDEGDYFIDVEN